MAMSGIGMMMKSFGLDPEVFQKGAEEFKEIAIHAQHALIAIDAKSTVIREQNETILKNQVSIIQKLDLILQNDVLNQRYDFQKRLADVVASELNFPNKICEPKEVATFSHEDEFIEEELVNNG